MNRRAFLLGVAMVLLGNVVVVALRAYVEAAFLERYGAAQFPWLLIFSAGGFAIATLAYDAITRRAHPRVVDIGLLVALGAAAAAAPTLLAAGAPPGALVVVLAAISQVAALGLWNGVSASLAGRDSRRRLPLAGAGVTAGGVIAGLGAGALIPRVGLPAIPLAAAGVTVAVLVLYILQQRALASGGAPGATAPAGTQEKLGELQRRLVVAFCALAALEAIVSTVLDLQFARALKTHYAGDALATALSLFYGGTNAVLLLLQVSAVPRLLVTRSLPFTFAIHPLVVIAGYLTFAASPGFLPLAGTRTADQVLRLATSRTSQEIGLSQLPPLARARWKVLLRGAIWPAGAGAAALVLLLVGPAAVAAPATLAWTAIAIAVLAWGAGRLAARRFQVALAAPLGIRAQKRDDPRQIDLVALERWTAIAGGAEPRAAALARAALARARVAVTDYADQLRHDSPAVRAALFDELARSPDASLRNELRAAVTIEDDPRALALGIKALALAGDDRDLARWHERADLAREVADAVRAAELTLRGGAGTDGLAELCERDPQWAIALIRARGEVPELAELLHGALADPARRAGALAVIACVGPARALGELTAALEAGDADAGAAIAKLDGRGAANLADHLAAISLSRSGTMPGFARGPGRAALARALAGASPDVAAVVVGALIVDRDPEVAYAALRTALAIARGGGTLPGEPVAQAHEVARRALVAYLDARSAATELSACARAELELATRRCVARLLWAGAVEAAAAGRDPAALTATARRLTTGGDAERRRALDIVQELHTGRPEILAVIERWLRPAAPVTSPAALAEHDPWLAHLVAGELAELEPLLVALRRAPLFAGVAGPALAELAARALRRRVSGTLFEVGARGDTMIVVIDGALVSTRDGAERQIESGGVVGELAVLTHAPRIARVAGDAEVLEINQPTFTAAARRAPELVLGLSATLAGWLAPNRPDLL